MAGTVDSKAGEISSAAARADAYRQENSGHYVSAMEALALAGAHAHAGGRFADVGCRSGEIAEAMADRDFAVAAYDGSPSMVEATRRRCAGRPVTVELLDAHRLVLPAGTFDVVHSSWVMHRLGDVRHALRTMARAVRPGGLLVLQWSFGQPEADGFPMRDVLADVVARPAWRARLAATPLAMHRHPVEKVRAALEAEGLTVVAEDRDVRVLGPRDPASLRRATRATALAVQADALGGDADAFVDEALRALAASGHTNAHHTRLIATRPDPRAAEGGHPPALVRPFPQAVGVLEVVSATGPTPLMRRLVLRSDAVRGLETTEPGEIITLFWPAEGTGEIVLPEPGKWRVTEGQHTRNLTVRAIDREAGEVTIDFFVHGPDGKAAQWAADAKPGDRVGFGGCRVHWVGDPAAAWTLLVGDETALPAMAAIIESRPEGHRTLVVAEVRDEREHAALDTSRAEAHWLHRGDRAPGRGRALEEFVRTLELPDGRGQVWAAGESLTIRSLRGHLVAERGLAKDTVSALGYWHHPRPPRARS